MSAEIQVDAAGSLSLYAQIRETQSGGQIWNGTAFQVYSSLSGNIATYPVAIVQQGTSTHYVGNMPTSIGAGVFDVTVLNKIHGWYDETDPIVANGEVQWNTVERVPLSILATSGQFGAAFPIRIAKGVMTQSFPVYLKSSADHITPFTSGIVSGQISRDGGAFGPLQSGTFTEVGLGHYSLQALTSGDTFANVIQLHFTATGVSGGQSDPLPLAFITQKVSGSL